MTLPDATAITGTLASISAFVAGFSIISVVVGFSILSGLAFKVLRGVKRA